MQNISAFSLCFPCAIYVRLGFGGSPDVVLKSIWLRLWWCLSVSQRLNVTGKHQELFFLSGHNSN